MPSAFTSGSEGSLGRLIEQQAQAAAAILQRDVRLVPLFPQILQPLAGRPRGASFLRVVIDLLGNLPKRQMPFLAQFKDLGIAFEDPLVTFSPRARRTEWQVERPRGRHELDLPFYGEYLRIKNLGDFAGESIEPIPPSLYPERF